MASESGGEVVRECGMAVHTPAYPERTAEALLCGAGKSAQSPAAAWVGGGPGESGHTRLRLSPFASTRNCHKLLTSDAPIQHLKI